MDTFFDTETEVAAAPRHLDIVARLDQARLPYQAPHIAVSSYKIIYGHGASLFEDLCGAAHS